MKTALFFLLFVFSQVFSQQQIIRFYGLEDPTGKSHLFYRLFHDVTNSTLHNAYDFKANIFSFDPAALKSSVLTNDQTKASGGHSFGSWFTSDFEYAKDDTATLVTGWNDGNQYTYGPGITRQGGGGLSYRGDTYNANGFNIETSAQNPKLLYASHSGNLYSSKSRLVKSTDGGRTWTPTGNDFYLLSVNKNNDTILFGRDQNYHLVMSKDEGKTSVVVDQVFQWPDYETYFKPGIYPQNDYVRFYYSSDKKHIFATAKKDSKYHLMRSGDNGLTWESILQEDSPFYICLDSEDPTLIYMAMANVLYHSYGFGNNFELDRFYPNNISGLYKTPDTKILYVATQFGIFESTTEGTKQILTLNNYKDTAKTTWKLYNESNSGLTSTYINCIMVDKDNVKWVGANNLATYNDSTWTVYNQNNSPLYDTYVTAMTTDPNNVKWISSSRGVYEISGDQWKAYNDYTTGGQGDYSYTIAADSKGNKWLNVNYNLHGLFKFDGTNFTFFNTSNSKLPSDYISSIKVDKNDNIWIGTTQGLARFDGGSNWQIFDVSNSGIPSNKISSVTVENSGNLWVGTSDAGLALYDGSNWTVFNTSNSGLPANSVSQLNIDTDGTKWMISDGSLVKFGDNKWTVYLKDSIGIPYTRLTSLAVDKNNKKWIGSDIGLILFDESSSEGSKSDVENNAVVKEFTLSQNFPNPFNPSTTISYSVPERSFVQLKIFDMLGREVSTLVSREQNPGEYKVQLNGSSLPSGVYIYSIQAGDFRASKKLILLK